MADLIDRQVAIDALHMHLMYRMGTDSNKKRLDEWINNLPSVPPEIIRCKDCKLYGDEKCLMRFDGHDWAEPDGFCHMAERKEQWEK